MGSRYGKRIWLLVTMILVIYAVAGCTNEEASSTKKQKGTNTEHQTDDVVSSKGGTSLDLSGDPIRTDEAAYTFMVFLNGTDLESSVDTGTNELYGAGSSDLEEMMNIGSTDDVNVVVQTGGTKEWVNSAIDPSQNQIWYVQNGNIDNLANLGNQNIGDPQTLTNFIIWTVHHFPAEKYVLDFWNHGGGPLGGFGSDEVNGDDSLTLKEIQTALQNAYQETGVVFEIIGFDACLMASVEIGYTVSPFGKYLVASEELEPGHGWDYSYILDKLTSNPSQNGEELGRVIADGFLLQSKNSGTDENVTLSVTDLRKIENVISNLDALMEQATLDLDTPSVVNAISGSRSKAESYGGGSESEGYSDLIDLGHFAQNLSSQYPEASNVLNAIRDAVVYKVNGDTRQYGEGLSIYFPFKDKQNFSKNLSMYFDFEFSEDYGEFIQTYTSVLSNDNQPVTLEVIQPNSEDDPFTVVISEDEIDNIEHIYSTLGYYIDDEETEILHLGMDNDIIYDPDTGTVKDNFSGYWVGLNGQFVSLYIKEETEEYNRYTIPVVLNGEDVNLIASWFWDDKSDTGGYYKVHGAWRGFLPDTNMPDKNLIDIKVGDEIIPLYEYTNDATGEEGLMEGEAFIIEDKLILEDVLVPNGAYVYQFYITDYAQNELYTEPFIIDLTD